MKYKIGDRVRIVSQRTGHMNPEGKMDKYLGTVMTIDYISCGNYHMIEDKGDWAWNDDDIAGLITKKLTREELFAMPIGTKITTNRQTHNVYVEVGEEDFCNDNADHIMTGNINNNLSLDTCCSDETKIIKIEKPNYCTVYEEDKAREMTVAEIEKELGYPVKVVRESEED